MAKNYVSVNAPCPCMRQVLALMESLEVAIEAGDYAESDAYLACEGCGGLFKLNSFFRNMDAATAESHARYDHEEERR